MAILGRVSQGETGNLSACRGRTQSALQRVVRAIEKKPSLLFLIRVCPYPYNVMNCLLAASPTLSFEVYTLATAISLFKVRSF